jgi:hypothetical protein
MMRSMQERGLNGSVRGFKHDEQGLFCCRLRVDVASCSLLHVCVLHLGIEFVHWENTLRHGTVNIVTRFLCLLLWRPVSVGSGYLACRYGRTVLVVVGFW